MCKRLVQSLLLIILSGCLTARVGGFRHQARSNLELGMTTKAQALEIIGEPIERSLEQTDGRQFERLTFMEMGPLVAIDPVMRALLLEFVEGTLNASLYVSTKEGADKNHQEFRLLKPGSANMQEVRARVGDPDGVGRCPSSLLSCEGSADTVWVWLGGGKGGAPSFSIVAYFAQQVFLGCKSHIGEEKAFVAENRYCSPNNLLFGESEDDQPVDRPVPNESR